MKINEIARRTCEIKKVELDDLKSKSRKVPLPETRALFWLSCECYDISRKEASEFLNLTLSNQFAMTKKYREYLQNKEIKTKFAKLFRLEFKLINGDMVNSYEIGRYEMNNKDNNLRKTYNGIEFERLNEKNFYVTLLNEKESPRKSERVISITYNYELKLKIKNKEVGTLIVSFRVKYADGKTKYFDLKRHRAGNDILLFIIKKEIAESQYKIKIV